jgi:hypothetical protein
MKAKKNPNLRELYLPRPNTNLHTDHLSRSITFHHVRQLNNNHSNNNSNNNSNNSQVIFKENPSILKTFAMILCNFEAVEPVVVNSIRSLGQKEDIDFLNDPHPQTGSMAEGGAAAVESTATEHLERGGPVAHAIVSPRHPAHHRDSFSDIYFTGKYSF